MKLLNSWDKATLQQAKNLEGPVLVIGASGFIGSQLFQSLLDCGVDVYGGCRNHLSPWRVSNKSLDRLVSMDVTISDHVESVFRSVQPKTVFFLSSYGNSSWHKDVERIYSVNVLGLRNCLKSSVSNKVKSFVHAGSSSEYGSICSGAKESDELYPNSDYSVSKSAAALLLKYYSKECKLPASHFRLFSVYGPGEEEKRLIPQLVMHGKQGSYPRLVSPKISRDFVYVDDITSGLVKGASHLYKSPEFQIYNLCSGEKSTIHEVAMLAKDLFKIPTDPEYNTMESHDWDLVDWYGSGEKAKEILGWEPRIPLREGLNSLEDWLTNTPYPNEKAKGKKLSAIIACYRDDQAIPIMHERLTQVFRSLAVNYEIIFVNDGSPSADEAVIDDICARDPKTIGIHHSRNFGSQSAFMSGLEICSGDGAIFLDGDLQDPPELIADFFKKWEEGYDVVYGVREKREAPFVMQVFYKLFYRIFRYMADVSIPKDAGDFSLVDRKIIAELLLIKEKDFFLRGMRAWVGFKQTGVPYLRPERMFGKTTNSLLKNIWWAKKGLFSFSTKPLHFIQGLGFFLFFLSLALIAFYLGAYFMGVSDGGKGILTIILLILGLGSIQLIATSVIGEYISKIVEEVKGRPRYIRKRLVNFPQSKDSKDG